MRGSFFRKNYARYLMHIFQEKKHTVFRKKMRESVMA